MDSETQAGRPDDETEAAAARVTSPQLSPSRDGGDDDCVWRAAAASKPVAMVQPRKVHGVRVLPSPTTTSRFAAAGQKDVAAAVKPSRLTRSPAIRAPRAAPPPHGDNAGGPRPSVSSSGPTTSSHWAGYRPINRGGDDAVDRSRDQRRHRYGRCVRRSANDNGVADDCATSNWQCKVSTGGGWPPAVGQRAGVAEGGATGSSRWAPPDDGDSAAQEALLMNKKKDAEIAALLRHIRLGGMSRDANHVRRRPAFNECLIERINFERSLGYYP